MPAYLPDKYNEASQKYRKFLMFVFISHLLLTLLYALSTWMYISYFYNNTDLWRQRVKILFHTAVFLHIFYFFGFLFKYDRIPIANSPEALGTFVLLSAIIYIAFEKRVKEESLGAFLLPLFTMIMFLSALIPHNPDNISPTLFKVSFEVHVLFMLVGYSGFTLSFVSSTLYLLLNHQLSQRKAGLFFRRLPSLQFFERISRFSIDGALFFIFLGFVTGSYFGFQVWSIEFLKDPKVISVSVTWLIYAGHFIIRHTKSASDKSLSILAISGYLFLILSSAISLGLLHSLHNFN